LLQDRPGITNDTYRDRIILTDFRRVQVNMDKLGRGDTETEQLAVDHRRCP